MLNAGRAALIACTSARHSIPFTMSQQRPRPSFRPGNPRRPATTTTTTTSSSTQRKRPTGELNLPIDERRKQQIWKELTIFNQDPAQQNITFSNEYSNIDRRYVHVVAAKLNLISKSAGSKKVEGMRSVTVSKPKAGDVQHQRREKHQGSSNQNLDTVHLTAEQRQWLVAFLAKHPNRPTPSTSQTTITFPQQPAHTTVRKVKSSHEKKSQSLLQTYNQWWQAVSSSAQTSDKQARRWKLMYEQRCKLPAFKQRQHAIETINRNRVTIVSGATGSGKSTQVPAYILEDHDARGEGGNVNIWVTEPRRVAAIALADRVSEERCEKVGDTVGYSIRLDSATSKQTRLTYCTVGVLLRKLASDPSLHKISHIVVDEIHERDKLTDFLLIVLRDLLQHRTDLKLILMSATINIKILESYFSSVGTSVLHIPGFTYPVHTLFLHDVVELTSYAPNQHPQHGRGRQAQRKQQDSSREKNLKSLLESQLQTELQMEENSRSAADTTMSVTSQSHVPPAADDSALRNILHDAAAANAADEAMFDPSELVWDEAKEEWVQPSKHAAATATKATMNDAATNGRAQPAASSGQSSAFGWVDNYSYKADSEAEYDPSQLVWDEEKQEFVNPSKPAKQTSSQPPAHQSTTTAPASVAKACSASDADALAEAAAAGQQQHISAQLEYSDATHQAIEQMEAHGNEYIDYNLVVATIEYICQKFSFSALNPASAPATTNDDDIDDLDNVSLNDGAILVFVAGWEDITIITELLQQHHLFRNSSKYSILPLHGHLAPSQQRQVFRRPPPGVRKIVISTNVAESSVTVADAVFVIDAGRHREKTYDAISKLTALSTTWISQANAAQRTGRAGRCRRGVCFRMYSTETYNKMDAYQLPELLRSPLEEICLQIKLLNLGQIQTFLDKAVEPPEKLPVANAIDLLRRLGALSADEQLTTLGAHLTALPTDPRIGKLILYGTLFKCIQPILTIAAALSYRDPFVLPAEWERTEAQAAKDKLSEGTYSDLITLLNAYIQWKEAQQFGGANAAFAFTKRHFLAANTLNMMSDLRKQFSSILGQNGLCSDVTSKDVNTNSNNIALLRALITAALYPHVAKLHRVKEGRRDRVEIVTRDGLNGARVHPGSVNRNILNKSLPKLGGSNDDKGDDSSDKNSMSTLPSRWLSFFEANRSSNVFLSSTTLVDSMSLLLLCGQPQQYTDLYEQQQKQAAKSSTDVEMEDSEDDSESDEFDDDDIEEGVSDDEDDAGNDDATITPEPTTVLALDEWLKLDVNRLDDKQHLLQLRPFIDQYVDKRLHDTVHNVVSNVTSNSKSAKQPKHQAAASGGDETMSNNGDANGNAGNGGDNTATATEVDDSVVDLFVRTVSSSHKVFDQHHYETQVMLRQMYPSDPHLRNTRPSQHGRLPAAAAPRHMQPPTSIQRPPARHLDAPRTAPAANRQPCSYFARGRCDFGDKCRFSHDIQQQQATQSQQRNGPPVNRPSIRMIDDIPQRTPMQPPRSNGPPAGRPAMHNSYDDAGTDHPGRYKSQQHRVPIKQVTAPSPNRVQQRAPALSGQSPPQPRQQHRANRPRSRRQSTNSNHSSAAALRQS